MGSGGVAIAALPTVICLKVPFSDGLGGYQQDRDTKSQEQQMAGTLNDSTFGSDNTFIYKDFILTTEIKRLRVLCCL